jgi:hypothetical protein
MQLADEAGESRRQLEAMPVDGKAGGLAVRDHIVLG